MPATNSEWTEQELREVLADVIAERLPNTAARLRVNKCASKTEYCYLDNALVAMRRISQPAMGGDELFNLLREAESALAQYEKGFRDLLLAEPARFTANAAADLVLDLRQKIQRAVSSSAASPKPEQGSGT